MSTTTADINIHWSALQKHKKTLTQCSYISWNTVICNLDHINLEMLTLKKRKDNKKQTRLGSKLCQNDFLFHFIQALPSFITTVFNSIVVAAYLNW